MDFKDSIKQISERIEKLKDNLPTEEATKNAFVMPFISALGYDVFNPLEVLPEMTCDIGTKKGEKIDYAIMKDGEPIMLIECKHWQQDLNLHDNQLLRYFNVSKAKFGVLTNGIIYRFYTDLEEPNKMDEKPFLEINMTDLKDAQIDELKKFHRSYFDIETILSSASELKYMGELRTIINKEFSNPSPEYQEKSPTPYFLYGWRFLFFSKSPQKVLLPGSNVFTRLSLKFWIILIYGLHHIFDIERRIRIRFIFFREKDVYIRCFQITQQRVYIVGFTILYPHNRVYSFPAGLFCNIIPTYALSLPHLF